MRKVTFDKILVPDLLNKLHLKTKVIAVIEDANRITIYFDSDNEADILDSINKLKGIVPRVPGEIEIAKEEEFIPIKKLQSSTRAS